MNASRDENRVTTLLGYNSTTGLAQALQAATASGRLLIDINVVSDSSPVSISGIRDENHIAGMLCVEDDLTGAVFPLIADSRNGYLYIDLIEE